MTTFEIDFSETNDFVAAWVLDGIANSCHKGVLNNTLKVAELLAAAKTVYEDEDPSSELPQAKLNRLATRVEMHEDQEQFFQTNLDKAAAAWCIASGKKSWTPYAVGNATPKNATATNKFFGDRLKTA
jgi:hypothetical protein